MAKLPSFQFYPGDWLRDNVSGCSLAAQGLWLRMMMLMHDSERYGYLQMNGEPMPPDSIARRCGCTPDEYATLLCELSHATVPSFTSNNIIYSRRMVRDAREREKNKSYVKKSREKSKQKGDCKVDVRLMKDECKTPLHSSSSISLKPPTPFDKGGLAPPVYEHKSEIPQEPEAEPTDEEFREAMNLWFAQVNRWNFKGRERENLSDALAAHGLAWVKAAIAESKSVTLFERFRQKEERDQKNKASPSFVGKGESASDYIARQKKATEGIVPIGVRIKSGEVKLKKI